MRTWLSLLFALLLSFTLAAPSAFADEEESEASEGDEAAEEEGPVLSLAQRFPVQISFGGYGGLAEVPGGGRLEGLWGYGIGFGVQIERVAALRLTRIAIGIDGDVPDGIGTVVFVRFAPVFELNTFIEERVEFFGQFGFDFNIRSEGEAFNSQAFQAAFLGSAGFRFWLADVFSLDVELDVTYAIASRYEPGFDAPVQTDGSLAGRLGLNGSLHF